MDWQPIATAPKDGTTIELMNEHNGLTDTGYWSDYIKRGFSLTGLDGEWDQKYGNGEMTHWRPLPPNTRPGATISFEDWITEAKRIAVEKFGFTAEAAESCFEDKEAWKVPYEDGDSPEDALIDDLSNA